MSDVPIGGRFHQRHRGVVDGDALLAGVRAATDRKDHVRRVAVHAVDECERGVRVDAADERCKKQALGIAIAAIKQRLAGSAQAAAGLAVINKIIALIIYFAIRNSVLHIAGERLDALPSGWLHARVVPVCIDDVNGHAAQGGRGLVKNPLVIRGNSIGSASDAVLRQCLGDGLFNGRKGARGLVVGDGLQRRGGESKVVLQRIGPCDVDRGWDVERGGHASGAHVLGVRIAANDA